MQNDTTGHVLKTTIHRPIDLQTLIITDFDLELQFLKETCFPLTHFFCFVIER